jgi:hypothetical protein
VHAHQQAVSNSFTPLALRYRWPTAPTHLRRVLPGLHLCGEVLDVFGRIGGFNFMAAWYTGRLAGLGAAGAVQGSGKKASSGRAQQQGAEAGGRTAAAAAAVAEA